MPKCCKCGKKGLFLQLSNGICSSCAKAELEEIENKLKDQKELFDKIESEAKESAIKKATEDIEQNLSNAEEKLSEYNKKISSAKKELSELRDEIVETRDEVMLQSFGLYTPHYQFMQSDEYKSRLLEIRAKQKDMVKQKIAVTGNTEWTVNGSSAKGKKMVSDTQKLLLRAFNSECDDAVEHVKYSNIESSEKKISSSKDAISNLGNMMGISITPEYYKLKMDELFLAFEYQQKKQEEKEAQKEARAQLREEAKLAKELEAQRAKLEKEQTHYQNVLAALTSQLETAKGDDKTAIEEKKKQIENQLSAIGKAFADVDYRAANQKAGYVYIISNIGAFGENVYKIGMTRRLDPMERVDELGDASVPFDFDVHAMIFSEDAPKLEAALHNAFADKKLNFVNQRREFFAVTLGEIKEVVKKNFDKTVEFVDMAPAEQYRESLLLKAHVK